MILIVTNKRDYTADYLISELNRQRIKFARFNTEDFPEKTILSFKLAADSVSGYLEINSEKINLVNITSIWYRRPTKSELSNLAFDETSNDFAVNESWECLQGLWRVLDCFWVSNPDKLYRAEFKPLQIKLAANLGFVVPTTLITNSPDNAKFFYDRHSKSIIYKPLKHSQLVRDEELGLIYTSRVTEDEVAKIDNLQLAPGIFQPYICKAFEVRVTVVGEKVFSVKLDTQDVPEALTDWRRVDASKITHTPHKLPSDIEEKSIELVKKLELAFGAIDLIYTPEGKYIFLEINPNGQWAWIQQFCPEVRIREALIDMLISGNVNGK